MATTRFVNLKQFGIFERMKIKTLSTKYTKKLERDLTNLEVILHCKKYEKTGQAAKYAFNAKIQRPVIFATDASDWDLATAVHKVMGKLERGVQKKFKTEGQKQGKVHVKQSKKRKR
jgi:ribosome-associated translation inhibitor RaiA